MSRIENITRKNIRDFSKEDTIYIQKKTNGFTISYFCKFVSFKSGVVTCEIISADPNPKLHSGSVGKPISGRITKCFLWGTPQDGIVNWNCCNWFNKNGQI